MTFDGPDPCGNDRATTESGTVDLKDIKAIIDLMKKNSISEFELERQDFKIKLKRGANGAQAVQYDEPQLVAYSTSSSTMNQAGLPVLHAPAPPSTDVEIKSPMIGTFY